MEKKDPFDSSGEARYISLDSAVLEARRLARLDDDRYRGRLGWDEIVWTELESQQRDDSYRVVLQFRIPTRDPEKAQTGEEEFIFNLVGTLLDRQVLVWPVSQSGTQSNEPIPLQPETQSVEKPPEPEEPVPAPEEVSEQPQVSAEAIPTPADTTESDPPANDSVPAENVSDPTHTRHIGTSASAPIPSRIRTDAERPIHETSVGSAIWVTLGVGILLVLFDLRNMWDPSFIPGPSSYTMYGVFPEALRDAAISAFGLTFYGTMFSPIGGALSGFAVYRWRTRDRRAEDAMSSSDSPQDIISPVVHALIGSVLGIGVIWLVLQAYPAYSWS
jgi:hypothetical protein